MGSGGTSFLPTTLEDSHHTLAERGAERTGAEVRPAPLRRPQPPALCLGLLCDGLDPGLFLTHSASCICRLRIWHLSVTDAGDMGSFPGLRRFPGGGNDNLLQYSCLGNPMDRGIGWATDGSVICVCSCSPLIVSLY